MVELGKKDRELGKWKKKAIRVRRITRWARRWS